MQGKVKQFPTGRLLCTPGAMDHVGVEEMMAAYYRHREGDWGDVCPEDWRSNDQAIQTSPSEAELLSSTSHLLFSFLPHSQAGKRSFKEP